MTVRVPNKHAHTQAYTHIHARIHTEDSHKTISQGLVHKAHKTFTVAYARVTYA